VTRTLKGIPHVISVQEDGDGRGAATNLVNYTVQSAVGADIREALASAVIGGGYGLMELRPAHLSLEEIFLQLTTSESTDGAA
jgi:hypothetical protein